MATIVSVNGRRVRAGILFIVTMIAAFAASDYASAQGSACFNTDNARWCYQGPLSSNSGGPVWGFGKNDVWVSRNRRWLLQAWDDVGFLHFSGGSWQQVGTLGSGGCVTLGLWGPTSNFLVAVGAGFFNPSACAKKYDGNAWVGVNVGISRNERINLLDVHGDSANSIWAAGDKGAVIHSANAGQSWTRRDLPSVSLWARAVTVLGPQNVIVAGRSETNNRGFVYQTTDGGVTWLRRYLTPANEWLSTAWNFSEGGSNYVIAAGRNSVVLSTDAGA